jgi:sugar phosphate isomerase/epimerase
MILGYNTNGFAHHRLSDAVTILAEIGYRSVAVTLEREHLDPPDRRGAQRAAQLIGPIVRGAGLHATIETGTRFLLDPRRKHQPTLVSSSIDERNRRIAFLEAAIDIAAGIGADSVSLWSGTADDGASEAELFDRLTGGLAQVLRRAEESGVRLSFEPEPGMFIDTMEKFQRLRTAIDHPLLGLTLDVGHVHCLNDGDLRAHAQRWRDRLWNIHIEDMRRGVHEHLPLGEGDIHFPAVFDALRAIEYNGLVHVELPRHSHDAVAVARRSYEFLHRFLE